MVQTNKALIQEIDGCFFILGIPTREEYNLTHSAIHHASSKPLIKQL